LARFTSARARLIPVVLLAALAAGCSSYAIPDDIESLYVKEGQGLGHRFIGEAAANYYVGIGDGIIIQVAGAQTVVKLGDLPKSDYSINI